MSFAKPTGSRFLFFAVLPFALFGIGVVTFVPPPPSDSRALWAVLAFDGMLALGLLRLWPYHRFWLVDRLLAGMAAVFLSAVLALMIWTGVLELPSWAACKKLFFALVGVGPAAYLSGYFALNGHLPWGEQWLHERLRQSLEKLTREEQARAKRARATWTRFLELRTSARSALVHVQLHGPDTFENGTPLCLSNDANPIEFERAIKEMTIWGEALDAGPEKVRVQLRSLDRSLVVGSCEAHWNLVCDWELLMRDGTLEGGYGLRALGALASQACTRLPGRVRRRLRRCRPLPVPKG